MSPSADPDAEALTWVHRGWDHLRLQRPLAAWAAWQRALRIKPCDPAATQALDVLASAPDLPAAARAVYRFRPPRDADARARWDAHFRDRPMDDLTVAAEAFRHLADADPADAPARYNEALCRAWLGENVAAIQALDQSVRLDAAPFPEAAVEAWMLAEILRQGGGAEELADDLNHSITLRWSGAGDGLAALPPWIQGFQPVSAPMPPGTGAEVLQDVRAFERLNRPMPDPGAALTLEDLPVVLETVIATPGMLRFSSPHGEGITSLEQDLTQCLELNLAEEFGELAPEIERSSTPLPLPMMDADALRFRLPEGLDESTRHQLVRGHIEDYFENSWIHARRHGLEEAGENRWEIGTPVSFGSWITDPSRDDRDRALARAKLEAVVRVREQLAARPRVAALYGGYPFDRLRRRVGLEPRDPATVDPADVSCMSLDALHRLDPATMDDRTLLAAFESARDGDLGAGPFTQELLRRGPKTLDDVSTSVLIDIAMALSSNGRESEGELDRAAEWVDRAIALDAERHGGRHQDVLRNFRRNLYRRLYPDQAGEP